MEKEIASGFGLPAKSDAEPRDVDDDGGPEVQEKDTGYMRSIPWHVDEGKS